MPGTDTITAQTTEERNVIAHLRTWCHDSTACPLCTAQARAFSAERTLDKIISG